MAFQIPSFNLGVLQANVDMSVEADAYDNTGSFQFCPMKVVAPSGAGVGGPAALAPCDTGGEASVGCLQNNPKLAEAGVVMVHGVTKAISRDTIAVGQPVSVHVSPLGYRVAQSGHHILGYALEAAVPGQTFTLLLLQGGKL